MMTTATTVTAYRPFDVRVQRVHRLSPSFVRVTMTDETLADFADNGYDQRIKLVLPAPDGAAAWLPSGPDWYAQWRALPQHRRCPIRTYTTRAVRPAQGELDVDMVRHGHGGPAARWAQVARPGDPLVVIGPDARHPGEHGGVAFRPPPRARTVLLAGDETAVPAAAAILERLPAHVDGAAVLEVPELADALAVAGPPRLAVHWLPRGNAGPGSLLVPEVKAAWRRLDSARQSPPAPEPGEEPPDDAAPLWEVPDPDGDRDCYAWLAGEAGAVRELRRHLVAECGLDRRHAAFMGYWRAGRPEA